MDEKLISIIVPVYNVENYIDRCLKSLIQQTYKNIQILIVNDGTKDNSMSIVADYADRDKRIEVYNKENGGLSDARNFALDFVKGEWICFVDSDDWIERDYIENLAVQFENDSGVDIALVDFDYAYDYGCKRREYQLKNCVLDREEGLKALCIGKAITNHVWNKIYKAYLFYDIRFEKGRKFEDIYIMHQLFERAKKISCSGSISYHYFMRDSSILHERKPQNDMDIFIGYKRRYDFLPNEYLKKIVLKFCACSCFNVLYMHNIDMFEKDDLEQSINFWENHHEISKLGLKYFVMYNFPHAYKAIMCREKR